MGQDGSVGKGIHWQVYDLDPQGHLGEKESQFHLGGDSDQVQDKPRQIFLHCVIILGRWN